LPKAGHIEKTGPFVHQKINIENRYTNTPGFGVVHQNRKILKKVYKRQGSGLYTKNEKLKKGVQSKMAQSAPF
jgi:hypothetical protein